MQLFGFCWYSLQSPDQRRGDHGEPMVETVRILGHESCSAPRSDPKKVEEVEKVEKKSKGRSRLSQGLIFLKVAYCRQGIFIFFLKLPPSLCFLKMSPSFSHFVKAGLHSWPRFFLTPFRYQKGHFSHAVYLVINYT